MGRLKRIFEDFGKEYIQTYPNLPKNHRKVIQAITDCRSGNPGKTMYQCQGCGKFHFVNQSCGNRHCPLCQYRKSQQWLQKQHERLLPGHHFMITFTVPEELRPFLRSHQRQGYSALFVASSEALKRLARDKKCIGTDLPGFTGILHTWGRQLNYHPSCKIPIRDIRTLVQQQSHTEGQEAQVFTEVKVRQLYCPDCGVLLVLVSSMRFLLPEFCDSG